MGNINMGDEISREFINLIEGYLNESNKKTSELKETLEEIFLKTNYEKLGIVINEFLKLYNTAICEELNPKLFSLWEESSSSLSGYLKNLGAGDDAEGYAKKLEYEINELLTKENNKFEFISLKNTETPEADENIFTQVKDNFQCFSKGMEEISDDFIDSINKSSEDNQLFMALLPLGEALHQTVQLFVNESSTVFDDLRDDYVRKISKNKDAANNLTASKLNNKETKTSGSTYFDGLIPLAAMNAKNASRKINKKYINDLRKFAQLFYKEKNNYNILKDFTGYIYHKLETGQKEIPLDVVSEIMSVYENYFTELGSSIQILSYDEWERNCEDPYKFIIAGENDNYFADDSDRWTYRSHYTNPAVYGLVARMVQKLCREYDFRSLFRSFYVIYDIILNTTGVREENLTQYSDYSIKTSSKLYEIIGEEPKLEQIAKSDDIDEIKAKEEQIILFEEYLKMHYEMMERLYKLYGKHFEAILNEPAPSLKSIESSKSYNAAPQKKYPVSYITIQKMSDYCKYVKLLKERQLSKFKESSDNSQENVSTLVGLCKGLLEIGGAFPVFKCIPFDFNKAFSGYEKVINAPKIKKFLSRDIRDLLDKYRNNSGNFIFNYTLEYHNFKQYNAKSEAPFFMPLNELAFHESNDELRDKIENAFLAAWKYINSDENYKLSYTDINNPNNTIRWAQCFTGMFIKLFKAGLLSQGVDDMMSIVLVEEIIPFISKSYNGVKPDLKVDINKRYIKI